jgi:hypothetical protein
MWKSLRTAMTAGRWKTWRRCDMWAVRTTRKYLAVFDHRWEAEQWLRDWVSIHGYRAYLARTER